jgi:uncharacterized PurR-regulated membrane protein YhhQ (DUF165 family)
MIWCVAYVAAVVLANYAFSVLPIWHGVPAATFIVGFVFVIRDFAQRARGHEILAWMALAAALSFWLADPRVALASVCAFAVSELSDWGLYTVTKRPMAERVLLSSAISTPLDSAVFLALLPFPGAFTWQAVAMMTAVKMGAALLVALWLWRLRVAAPVAP